jgi:hypothetical protein
VEARATFLRVIAGDLAPDEAIVRFDPVVDRALHFAAGEGLITVSGEMIILNEKGDTFVKQLLQNKECMVDEKAFLAAIGRKLTQVQIEAFLTPEPR